MAFGRGASLHEFSLIDIAFLQETAAKDQSPENN